MSIKPKRVGLKIPLLAAIRNNSCEGESHEGFVGVALQHISCRASAPPHAE